MSLRAGAGGNGGPVSEGGDRRSCEEAAPGRCPAVVTTAAEAAGFDSRAIASGIPSRALMQRAGAAAAGEIAKLLRETARAARLRPGALVVYAGAGNNGGDGWVVARALASTGVAVDVIQVGELRTDDARAERALAEADPLVRVIPYSEDERTIDAPAPALIVDALLGTGTRGEPREPVAGAIARIARARDAGTVVVSLDIPSGVDADTGAAAGAIRADVTLTFGTIKRGILVARGSVGRVVLLDIGLPREVVDRALGGTASSVAAKSPVLIDDAWLRSVVPPFAADAHKGTRGKLVIVGGQRGMAGAPVLAARAAMRSGIGMVRLVVSAESLSAVQASEPHALARAWPGPAVSEWEEVVSGWADVVLVGPGLGASNETRKMVESLLDVWRGPVVLDADALNVFAGEAAVLRKLLGERKALLTPHAPEFGRLAGLELREVLDRRFEVGADLARTTGAAVLLKGVPTVVSAPDGRRLVSARGTPTLATAGSGDLLGGIAATLLGQVGDPADAGAAAAWVHGRAAEIAERSHAGRAHRGRPSRHAAPSARGTTLADVEACIADVWTDCPEPLVYPMLAELPAVGAT